MCPQRYQPSSVRLADVAELAGVSVKTVSNVVNKQPHVRPETRSRVEEAIARLGYRPNLSARQLKYGRSGFIALVVPDLESPYFAELAAKFSAEAARRGYMTLFEATGADHDSEETVLSGLPRLAVDGIVFSPLTLSAAEIEERASAVPMTLLGERAVPRNLPLVAVDSVAAARAMTEHLISLGCRRIAAIGREAVPDPSSAEGIRDSEGTTASVRLQGYRQALDEAGLGFDASRVIGVDEYSRSAGHDAMLTLLGQPEPPDAVFCFNDLMAIGALRACHESGVSVPGQVKVAGFDNIVEGRYTTPTLTTVAPDLTALVSSALDELLDRIEGRTERTHGARIMVDWTLKPRESTLGVGGPAHAG